MQEPDTHNLSRFVEAQADCYQAALAEIRNGEKQTHWMWFIFPQYAGLGISATSQRYAIKSQAEAHSYLAHPIIGPRLLECASALLAVQSRTATQIFGEPDDAKLKSSCTLFAYVSPHDSVFHQLLAKYFTGTRDERTLELIRADSAKAMHEGADLGDFEPSDPAKALEIERKLNAKGKPR